MKDLKIISLTKVKLKEALVKNLYWKSHYKIIPFSKSKAKWLLGNERIENDDVCAILVLNNDILVSFIFLIPDWIKTNQGISKIYWSERWWIHEKYKNTVLSAYTNKLSLEATNNQILIKYLGTDTIAYYKKQPYTEFSERTRYIFVFNLDHNLIGSKLPFLKKVTSLLKVLTKISHFFISKINALKTDPKEFSYEYISTIDNNSWDFIKQFTANDLIPKSKSYINWQIDNNQYTIYTKENKFAQECLISSVSNKIHNVSFLVIRNNKTIGFISALVRANEFVIRYLLCNDVNYEYCLDALMINFIKSNCTYLLTENGTLGKKINKKFNAVYQNKRQLISLAHNDIDYDFKNKRVFEQDGHFA